MIKQYIKNLNIECSVGETAESEDKWVTWRLL